MSALLFPSPSSLSPSPLSLSLSLSRISSLFSRNPFRIGTDSPSLSALSLSRARSSCTTRPSSSSLPLSPFLSLSPTFGYPHPGIDCNATWSVCAPLFLAPVRASSRSGRRKRERRDGPSGFPLELGARNARSSSSKLVGLQDVHTLSSTSSCRDMRERERGGGMLRRKNEVRAGVEKGGGGSRPARQRARFNVSRRSERACIRQCETSSTHQENPDTENREPSERASERAPQTARLTSKKRLR